MPGIRLGVGQIKSNKMPLLLRGNTARYPYPFSSDLYKVYNEISKPCFIC